MSWLISLFFIFGFFNLAFSFLQHNLYFRVSRDPTGLFDRPVTVASMKFYDHRDITLLPSNYLGVRIVQYVGQKALERVTELSQVKFLGRALILVERNIVSSPPQPEIAKVELFNLDSGIPLMRLESPNFLFATLHECVSVKDSKVVTAKDRNAAHFNLEKASCMGSFDEDVDKVIVHVVVSAAKPQSSVDKFALKTLELTGGGVNGYDFSNLETHSCTCDGPVLPRKNTDDSLTKVICSFPFELEFTMRKDAYNNGNVPSTLIFNLADNSGTPNPDVKVTVGFKYVTRVIGYNFDRPKAGQSVNITLTKKDNN